MKESFDIFPDQITFQIDFAPDPFQSQRGRLCGVRDDRDLNFLVGHLIDRQTDPINCDRSLFDAIPKQFFRNFNRKEQRLIFLATVSDPADTVNMPAHEVSAQSAVYLHGALEIHGVPHVQGSQVRDGQRLERNVRPEFLVRRSRHGQANAVHRDAVTDGKVFQDRPGEDGQPSRLRLAVEAPDNTHLLNETGKHETIIPEAVSDCQNRQDMKEGMGSKILGEDSNSVFARSFGLIHGIVRCLNQFQQIFFTFDARCDAEADRQLPARLAFLMGKRVLFHRFS